MEPLRVAKRLGGLVGRLVGGAFAVAGIALVYGAFNSPKNPLSHQVILGVGGLVFGIPGLLLFFGRSGYTVDRAAGTVTTWWRVFGYGRDHEEPLDSFNRVVLLQQTDSEGSVHYGLSLEGDDYTKSIHAAYGDTRMYSFAEKIAAVAGKTDEFRHQARSNSLDPDSEPTRKKGTARGEEIARYVGLPFDDRSAEKTPESVAR